MSEPTTTIALSEYERLQQEILRLQQLVKDLQDLSIDQQVEIGQLKKRLGEL